VTPRHCVTLLTDYGLEDGFVAACHGVIASICPPARIIDITHLVPPGDVRRGAAVMAQTVPYLPAGVHVAVIDPGVGTRRRAIAVAVGDRVFVGPDNGVLSWAATDEEIRAFELTDRGLWLDPVSATFHGRDIFSPVAAHIAAGRDVATVGEEIDPAGLVRLPPPARNVRDDMAEGEVVTVDRFGNVQLSVTGADLDRIGARYGEALTVTLGRHSQRVSYGETFGSVPPGELVAYTDAAGQVALAVNSGNAAQRLGLPPGAHVRLAIAK
jgi:S-adenosyl-L-methionine hydrolase (adenosine-forming)